MTSDNSVVLQRFVDDPGGRLIVDYNVARLDTDVMSRVAGCARWITPVDQSPCTEIVVQSPNGRAMIASMPGTNPPDLRLVLLYA
jgi:hypothetical protein